MRAPIRPAVAAAALAAVLAVPLLAPGGAGARAVSQLSLTALEESTYAQINALRAAHGLSTLTLSNGLSDSARLQCLRMLAGGYFAHQVPGGQTFVARLEHFYPPRGFDYYSIGENLYWTDSAASSSEIMFHWMHSAPHRANLLHPTWRQVGLAAVTVPSAPGVYDGLPVTVVAADFGVRG